MTERVFNFSPGPATLPLPVLQEVQQNLLALPGVGASVLEISHRSKTFEEMIAQAEANIRALLNLPEEYHVLFLQGGASLQFSQVPMSFLRGTGRSADYIVTGSWGEACDAVAFSRAPEARLSEVLLVHGVSCCHGKGLSAEEIFLLAVEHEVHHAGQIRQVRCLTERIRRQQAGGQPCTILHS